MCSTQSSSPSEGHYGNKYRSEKAKKSSEGMQPTSGQLEILFNIYAYIFININTKPLLVMSTKWRDTKARTNSKHSSLEWIQPRIQQYCSVKMNPKKGKLP